MNSIEKGRLGHVNMTFYDRLDAGRQLAQKLKSYQNKNDVITLALPRGGVPVAYEIAKMLKCPLDIFMVRKIGMPSHPEFALGALAFDGVLVWNQDTLSYVETHKPEMDAIITQETKELHRREALYRMGKKPADLSNKTVILVDDGIATGATIKASISALHQAKVKEIVIAVPVASNEIIGKLKKLVSDVICLYQPTNLGSVGQWYENFEQTTDANVIHYLK